MNQETQIEGYPLEQHDNGDGTITYSFMADDGREYDIDVEDAPFLFEGMPFNSDVKMISLVQPDPAPKVDPRIPPTMRDAIDKEITKNKNLILSYICSAKDQQHIIRARLFGNMFAKANKDGEYKLVKITLRDTYGGVITRHDNPALGEIESLVK